MAQTSRTAQFAKLFKVLKKHYKPVAIDAQRSVLEHLLFACLLQESSYEAAQTAMAALVHTFFDWNEVRVTSIAELSEVMAGLPDPRAAATRIKRVLHAIFEANYSFDLEDKHKKNLGVAQKWFERLDGCTPFVVAHVTQASLNGHAIPLDAGTMQVMQILDLANEKEVAACTVAGLERAIAKSKGAEFASLLHQLGAEFSANPFAPKIRDILLEISPDATERMPKRRAAKPPAAPEKGEAKAKHAGHKAEEKSKSAESKKDSAGAEKPAGKRKADEPGKPAAASKPAAEKPPAKPAAQPAEKPAAKKAPEKPAEKPQAKPAGKAAEPAKKKHAVSLGKKKPR